MQTPAQVPPSTAPTLSYRDMPLQEAMDRLGATSEGLTSKDAVSRLAKYGRNELTEPPRNPVADFLRRYWGPMPWLLELAMVLSFILKRPAEGVIILVLLTMNAIIGFWHSQGSHKAVSLLKQRLALQARVLRDGNWQTIEVALLVPGDVITVRLGDIIPSDAKIITGDVSIDESALTGESLPIEKNAGAVIYSGSVIRQGEARCLVINTGYTTYFGRTAELVNAAKPKSHQEAIALAIVKYMMYLGIAASLIVAGDAAVQHHSFLLILTFIVVFLMGSVPVALPAVLTIVQAATGIQLSKSGVLVTRLESIEDAASVSVLCMDKTGTITMNQLSVVEAVGFEPYVLTDTLNMAALASREDGIDLIDLAILEYAKAQGANGQGYKQLTYTPFNPAVRRTEATASKDGLEFKVIKGASQVVAPMCTGMDAQELAKVDEHVQSYSRKGYRTIAVARSKEGEPNALSLVGLVALADPPRPDSRQMIAEIKQLGVKPIMLTGDNMAIAKEIAVQVGIGENISRLSDVAHLQGKERATAVATSDGFAEIYPEDKYQLVKLLQEAGYMVAMTGDGVNDAPALKQAEMGIAVNNATDVAKASASVVLTEPGIQVIVKAVELSRETYQRMLTWVINKVMKVIQVVGLLTIGYFMVHEMIVSMLGISLLIFANDFVTISLATDNVKHTLNPNSWDVANIMSAALVVGVLLIGEGLATIWWGIHMLHLDIDHLRTLVLLMLVFTSQLNVLMVRERRSLWASRPGTALIVSSLSVTVLYIALGISGILIPAIPLVNILEMLAFLIVCTILFDFPKRAVFHRFHLS